MESQPVLIDGRAREVGSLSCSLVSEESQGRLRVDAVWPAISALRDPAIYLSGPPAMLAALTSQLHGHGVAVNNVRVDAWE